MSGRDSVSRGGPTGSDHALEPYLAEHALPRSGALARLDGFAGAVRDLVLSDRGVHYLALFAPGSRMFEVDVLAAVAPGDAGRGAAEARRVICRIVGRKLTFHSAWHLDDWLAQLRTGPLIRTVLRTDRGAVYCFRVVPDAYLFGATVAAGSDTGAVLAAAEFDVVDREVGWLAEDIRRQIRLAAVDYGGWTSERWRQELERAEQEASQPELRPAGDSPPDGQITVSGADGHRAVGICRAEVAPDQLHSVGLFDNGEPIFSVDLLSDESLYSGREYLVADPIRRQRLQTMGVEVPAYLRELARTARPLIDGPVRTAVLDVEHGALFYRRLGSTRYLVGLTMYQERVHPAEEALDRIFARWPS